MSKDNHNSKAFKKDFIVIGQLNQRINYDDAGDIKKVYSVAKNNALLETQAGERYLKSLEGIISGENRIRCFICNKKINVTNAMCQTCLQKIKLLHDEFKSNVN